MRGYVVVGLIISALLFASAVHAEVPNRLTYQGRLARRGVSVSGNHIFVVRIIGNDGTPLWSSGNITQKLPITGDFALVLEPNVSVADWLNNRPVLEVSIDGEKFTSNEPFGVSPYAYVAKTVEDGAITNAKLTSDLNLDALKVKIANEVTLDEWRSPLNLEKIDANVIQGSVPVSSNQIDGTAFVAHATFTQTMEPKNYNVMPLIVKTQAGSSANLLEVQDADGNSKVKVLSSGNVGIGTASPAAKLDVVGDIKAQSMAVTNLAPLFGYKVGTFTSSASPGNQSITGVGFKPRLIIMGMMYGDGTLAFGGLGWATATNSATVFSFRTQDAAAGAVDAAGQTTDATAAIRWCSESGATQGNATLTSMDNDGFTLNWTDINGPRIIAYIAFQ